MSSPIDGGLLTRMHETDFDEWDDSLMFQYADDEYAVSSVENGYLRAYVGTTDKFRGVYYNLSRAVPSLDPSTGQVCLRLRKLINPNSNSQFCGQTEMQYCGNPPGCQMAWRLIYASAYTSAGYALCKTNSPAFYFGNGGSYPTYLKSQSSAVLAGFWEAEWFRETICWQPEGSNMTVYYNRTRESTSETEAMTSVWKWPAERFDMKNVYFVTMPRGYFTGLEIRKNK